jgi:hypothetical protein
MQNLVESLKPFEKVDITNVAEVEAAFKEMVPYSAKVKTPLRGWSSNFRTLLEPALDAKC